MSSCSTNCRHDHFSSPWSPIQEFLHGQGRRHDDNILGLSLHARSYPTSRRPVSKMRHPKRHTACLITPESRRSGNPVAAYIERTPVVHLRTVTSVIRRVAMANRLPRPGAPLPQPSRLATRTRQATASRADSPAPARLPRLRHLRMRVDALDGLSFLAPSPLQPLTRTDHCCVAVGTWHGSWHDRPPRLLAPTSQPALNDGNQLYVVDRAWPIAGSIPSA